MTPPRMPRAVAGATLFILLAACGDAATPAATPREPAGDASPAASAEPTAAESPEESEAPSPAETEEATGGLALADAEVAALIGAYEEYGFTFDEPGTNDAGDNVHIGVAEDEEVAVRITETDNTISEVLLVDYSAGEVGLEEMGFTIGIFEPEAQTWLIEQLEEATADPGTPLTATMDFEHVSMQLEAFTDDEQSIDLYLTDR
ncbi:MAG TPA: hypothetical protein VHK06_00700 [Candidatus Limnocylindria bacterium]|nr:hypothetical protein [Candidatus Limnocylindria bacterium]